MATEPQRTPEEIRSSIESNRLELSRSITHLRGEVAELTNWRRQLELHKRELATGAAVLGAAVGGLVAVASFLRRR
jgi:hypothetical protein